MYILIFITQLVQVIISGKGLKDIIDSIPQNSKPQKIFRNIITIIFICLIICMCITTIYTNINIINTVNEISQQSEFEAVIVSENYNKIINDNRGKDYYTDAEKCKGQIRIKAIIMTVVSFSVFISALVVIKKLKNIKMLVATLFLLLSAYNVISPLFIMPIERPVSISITIPIDDTICNTTLEDGNKYTTTTSTIKTADVTTIEYYGETRTQYMFIEVLISTDICLIVIVGLYLIEKRLQFLAILRQVKNKLKK